MDLNWIYQKLNKMKIILTLIINFKIIILFIFKSQILYYFYLLFINYDGNINFNFFILNDKYMVMRLFKNFNFYLNKFRIII